MPEQAGSSELMRRKNKEAAAAKEEADKDALVRHIEEQDAKFRKNQLKKQALVQKRLTDAHDLTPTRRKMYNDKMCADAALLPGPGAYTPRMAVKDISRGKTFSVAPFISSTNAASGATSHPDRDAGSLDAYRVKVAASMPGPASYTPSSKRIVGGSTFGPSQQGQGMAMPDAHDISKMVAHLRDLPAPDAYSPRDPMAKSKGFRMVPSKARSTLEQIMLDSALVPGPGTYQLTGDLSAGRSTVMGGAGKVKSEIEIGMERARLVPGPGAYESGTTMRSKGSPRFSKSGGTTMMEAIQIAAKV